MNMRAILVVLVGSCAAWSPIAAAEVTLRPNGPVPSVESIKQGRLPFRSAAGAIEVTLPLDSTDVLLLQ